MDAKHILLVEDEPGVQLALSRALESQGHTVVPARTAQAAIHALTTETFDLLVIDINLPDSTGWSVLQWLSTAHRQRLPVIVMSALPPSVARIHEFSPIGVLTKPFPVDALYRMVNGVSSLELERIVNE